MPIQDHFAGKDYRKAFREIDRAFEQDRSETYRKLRDLWLAAQFRRAESEALDGAWREFCLSSLAWGEGRELEALERLHRGSLMEERFFWMRYYVAEILLRRLDLYDKARAEIQVVVTRCPWLWEARCLWTEALMAVGHPDPLKAVRSVDVKHPVARAAFLAWRGALQLWWGESEAAVKDLDESAAMDNPDALCWRGGALCSLGKLKESQRDLDRLLTLDPGDPEGLVWRGELRRKLKDRTGALADLDKVIGISGVKPWALANRALLRLEQKDFAAAYADFAAAFMPHQPPGVPAPPPALDAKGLKRFLEQALKDARGCRRSDPHLNFGWMRATGVPVPARPPSGARLTPYTAWKGLPVPPEQPLPGPLPDELLHERIAAMLGPGA